MTSYGALHEAIVNYLQSKRAWKTKTWGKSDHPEHNDNQMVDGVCKGNPKGGKDGKGKDGKGKGKAADPKGGKNAGGQRKKQQKHNFL